VIHYNRLIIKNARLLAADIRPLPIIFDVIGELPDHQYSNDVVVPNLTDAFNFRGTIMSHFPIYTLDSAPEQSKPAMNGLAQAFGMVPNLIGAIAGSPKLINGLVGVFQQVHGGSFTEAQVQTLLLTNAVTNEAAWPVAFHSFLALKEGLSETDVQAIRARRLPQDKKLAALSHLARTLIEKRGRLDDEDIAAFTAAGFDQALVLEVVLVVAASTITNYSASVANPPLEEMFAQYAWQA
jgi:alkylhydroperoxidase family enzyme